MMEEILQYVENLCKTFIRQYQKLYKCNVVYNIHSLIHIVDDVRKFGVLDSISAFPYESMLGNIKHKLRSGHLPLAQICHRISEGQFCYSKKQQQKENMMIINGSVIKPKILKNSCVLLRNKSIALVNKVEGSLLNVSIFKNKRPAFSYPCSSEISEMFIVDKNLEASSIILSDIEKKVSYLPWEKLLLCFCSSPLIVNFLSSSLQIFSSIMYSVVIFHRENTVEGVPSIWLKILAGKHYCSWPIEKCKVRQYIKSYIKPSRKWDLIPCSVKRVVEKYEDLSAACEEVRYLTSVFLKKKHVLFFLKKKTFFFLKHCWKKTRVKMFFFQNHLFSR